MRRVCEAFRSTGILQKISEGMNSFFFMHVTVSAQALPGRDEDAKSGVWWGGIDYRLPTLTPTHLPALQSRVSLHLRSSPGEMQGIADFLNCKVPRSCLPFLQTRPTAT